MGFFRRLLGLRAPNSPHDQLMRSIGRSATLLSAPHDEVLWRQAEASADSLDETQAEYNRLIMKKYG